ncbi:hypothetical protein LCGC14_1940230, partial [marine sediment metagenome]
PDLIAQVVEDPESIMLALPAPREEAG